MAEAVSLHLFGEEFFRRRIQAMRYRARDMSPVLHDIKEDWLAIIEEQFATEGARAGRKWAKLSLDTVLRRGSAHPILIDTADMLLHVTDPEHIRVTDDSVTIRLGSGRVAARAEAHQYGFMNALTHRPVPARPIIDFTDLDDKLMRRKIRNYLVRGDRHQ